MEETNETKPLNHWKKDELISYIHELREAPKPAQEKKDPALTEWTPNPDLSFDENVFEFNANFIMPFHGYVSRKNMNKNIMSPELDMVITLFAKANTVLTKRMIKRKKEGTFGKE